MCTYCTSIVCMARRDLAAHPFVRAYARAAAAWHPIHINAYSYSYYYYYSYHYPYYYNYYIIIIIMSIIIICIISISIIIIIIIIIIMSIMSITIIIYNGGMLEAFFNMIRCAIRSQTLVSNKCLKTWSQYIVSKHGLNICS